MSKSCGWKIHHGYQCCERPHSFDMSYGLHGGNMTLPYGVHGEISVLLLLVISALVRLYPRIKHLLALVGVGILGGGLQYLGLNIVHHS